MTGKFCEQLLPPRNNCLKLNKTDLFISLFLFVIGIFLLPKTAYLSSITPEKIIELTNTERRNAGVHEVQKNVYLQEAAIRKAESILKEQIFDHNIKGKEFSQWVNDVGYNYAYIGENLAIDFITAEGTVKAWMESENHKKNLLDDEYTEIGVAAVSGSFEGAGTIVVSQIFGRPAGISIPPEIVARQEKLRPLNQYVLSASDGISIKRIPIVSRVGSYLDSSNSTSTSSMLTIAFSIFLTLILAYLYILSLSCLAGHPPHKE